MFWLTILVTSVAVATFLLGLLVFLRNSKSEQHGTFFIFAVFISVWMLLNFFGSFYIYPGVTQWLVLSDFAVGAFLGWSFWLFTYVLYKKSISQKLNYHWNWGFIIINILLAALSYLGQVVQVSIINQDLSLSNQAFYEFYVAFLAVYILGGLYNLIRARIKATGVLRSQVSVMLFGLVLAVVFVAVPNIVLPNILERGPILTFIENLAYFGILLYVGITAYAIVKHRLFDIRLIVARSVAYTLLLGTLGLVYGFAIFGASALFFAGDQITLSQQIVYAVLAVVLAFTFQPLRRFFEKITDRIFYRDRYVTQDVLNQISRVLAEEIDIDVVARSILKLIGRNLKLRNASFVVMDEDKIYRVEEYGAVAIDRLDRDQLERLRQSLIVTDELNENPLKHMLAEHNIAATLRLKTQSGIVGYLLLGPKSSGSIYTGQDVELLEILSNELAVAVENAISFEKIADFNVTLQERIREATAQLRAQNVKLKELDRAKDEFISMASHQLRTPLTTIKGYLSMLLEGDAGKLRGEQQQFTDLAYLSAQRMVYLIADMLNVSRISTGRLTFDIKEIDLVKLAREEIAQLKRTAEAKNVKLHFNPPKPKLPPLKLDPGKTRQVMMNFMDNAIYYAPDTTVEVYLEHKDSKVRFLVKDKGIGVPKKAQKELFAKFYRAENAKKSRPDGTGLGLYMAKMVIEELGGQVIFESQEGKGSTFGFEYDLDKIAVKPDAKTQRRG